MKLSLPVLLSVISGYVDAAGFLALQGLFTSHVTGNFVTLGAALVLGSSGILAKLIALPVFCCAVALVRVLGYALASHPHAELRILLVIKVSLLTLGAAMAIRLGPFANSDAAPALATGMTLVCAMAVSNALQRVHLRNVPPVTIMTGNTTQVMIDLVDLLRGLPDPQPTRSRFAMMCANIAAFAFGCASAALLFVALHMWCFTIPPLLAVLAILVHRASPATVEAH